MKRYVVQIGTAVVLAVSLVVSWPLIHTNLIRAQIKNAIRRSPGPLPSVDCVGTGISDFDPPDRVLGVLWDLATNPKSTKSEREHAGAALAQISTGTASLRTGHRYSQEDWDEAFNQLLERERKRGVKRSAPLDQWLDYLDRNWRASSSGTAIPP
jgi:hypothetical protein